MHAPITISGGGIIGNYIAIRLKRNNIDTVIIEKSKDEESLLPDIRTLTLNNHSVSLLEEEGIVIDTAPIKEIHAMDGEGSGKIQFSSDDINENYLSHVVSFNVLQNALKQRCKNATIFSNEIKSIQNLNNENIYEVILSDDRAIKTSLIAGCDGRNSKVAKISGLSSIYSEYRQTAITFIAEIENSMDIETAFQVFSEKGIFALMPVINKDNRNNRCTIVWSIDNNRLEKKDIKNYVKKNLCYFESKLNMKIKVHSEILSFKLSKHYFEDYSKESVVLIGDAAHSIHPLAGQGINLGFADADIFCEEVIKAFSKGFPINENVVLKRYEIRRKGMNLLMLRSMDFFVNFFSNSNLYVRLIRNWGLNRINKTRFLKAFFIKHASGINKI